MPLDLGDERLDDRSKVFRSWRYIHRAVTGEPQEVAVRDQSIQGRALSGCRRMVPGDLVVVDAHSQLEIPDPLALSQFGHDRLVGVGIGKGRPAHFTDQGKLHARRFVDRLFQGVGNGVDHGLLIGKAAARFQWGEVKLVAPAELRSSGIHMRQDGNVQLQLGGPREGPLQVFPEQREKFVIEGLILPPFARGSGRS